MAQATMQRRSWEQNKEPALSTGEWLAVIGCTVLGSAVLYGTVVVTAWIAEVYF